MSKGLDPKRYSREISSDSKGFANTPRAGGDAAVVLEKIRRGYLNVIRGFKNGH